MAGAGAGPELFGAVPAGAAPGGAAAGEIAGAAPGGLGAPGGPEVLGATQGRPGAVLGGMQQRPRVLPFGGLSPLLAMVIGSGKWFGAAMMVVGVGLLLAAGLRRRGMFGA